MHGGEEPYLLITKGLTEREVFILMNRIIGRMSLADIGEKFGISVERVRQIEARTKAKLEYGLILSMNATG
jgi:RNA polymerase sigma factor (sigma-70 family)